jgi:hypothetical protein
MLDLGTRKPSLETPVELPDVLFRDNSDEDIRRGELRSGTNMSESSTRVDGGDIAPRSIYTVHCTVIAVQIATRGNAE